jgi:hypothetical protein
MKKLLLLATAIGATALVAPRAQAGISFGIRIGPDFHRPAPVYVAPPVHCAPPVYVAPRPICPPVVVAPPAHCAPPAVVYYGHRSHGWRHQHRYQGYRHDAYHGHNRHHYRH